jgi:hypothetical protein
METSPKPPYPSYWLVVNSFIWQKLFSVTIRDTCWICHKKQVCFIDSYALLRQVDRAKRNEQNIWHNYGTGWEATGGFAAPIPESELQTTQHTTPPTGHSTHHTTYCPLNTLHHLLPTQHTTPPTAHSTHHTTYCPLNTPHHLLPKDSW